MYIEHVGITVRELERSVTFYSTIFGTEPIERYSWEGEQAEYVAAMMNVPGLTLDAAFFRLPGSDVILEIIEFHGISEPEDVQAIRHHRVGGVHMGFYVPNLTEVLERIEAAGSDLMGPPVTIEYGPYFGHGHGRAGVFRDPDGNNLQLMEISGRPGNLRIPAGSDIGEA